LPRGRARGRPGIHGVRLRSRRSRDGLHASGAGRRVTTGADEARGTDSNRRLTGLLLVGGGSERFGSPKALALFRGETVAEGGPRVLARACDEAVLRGEGGARAVCSARHVTSCSSSGRSPTASRSRWSTTARTRGRRSTA